MKAVTPLVIALAFMVPAASFAATYAYVDTSSNVRSMEAASATQALATAPNIARTSGVILLPNDSLDSLGGTTSSESTGMSNEDSQAGRDLRNALRSLLTEHVEYSMDVLRAISDEDGNGSDSDLEDALDRQDMNADELSAAIGSVYGADAEAAFKDLFKKHIEASNDYTRALVDEDDEAMDEAYDELLGYLRQISSLLAGANPNISNADLLAALTQHENLLNDSSEAYIDGDEEESEDLEDQAVEQIRGGADYLADAIIKQYPDKF